MNALAWFALIAVILIGYIFCHNVWEKLQDIDNNVARLLNELEDPDED